MPDMADQVGGEVHKQAKNQRAVQCPPVRTEEAQSNGYLLYGKIKTELEKYSTFSAWMDFN